MSDDRSRRTRRHKGAWVELEHCRDCVRHQSHTKHSEAKYKEYAENLIKALDSAATRPSVSSSSSLWGGRKDTSVGWRPDLPVEVNPGPIAEPGTKLIQDPVCPSLYKTMVRHDKLGWISDGGRRRLYPRCGAFEVSLHYRGERQKIFSKLDEQKWPNPDWLARRILKTVDEKEADFEARNPQFSRDMSPPASTSSSFGRVPMLKAPSETDISTTVPSEAPAIGDSELLSSEASAPRFGATKAHGPVDGTEPGDMIDVSAVADAETMQLRFRHLDYDNVDHKYFKLALLSGLQDLGLTAAHADTLQIRLSKGSILAEISGPLPSMRAVKSLPLSTLRVFGYPAELVDTLLSMGKPLARPLSAMSQMSDIKAKETLLPAALLTQHPADSWKDQNPSPAPRDLDVPRIQGQEVSPILPIKPVAPKKVEEAVEQAAGNLEEEKIPSRQNDAEYGDEYGDDWEEEPEEEEEVSRPNEVVASSPPQPAKDAPAIDSIKAAATPNNNNLTGHSEMKTEKANAAAPEPAAPAPKMSTEDDYEDEDFEDASQDDVPAETVGQEGQATSKTKEDEHKADSSYGSEDFEQEPEDKPGSGGPAAVTGAPAKDAAESSDLPASPAGKYSDYSDEPFEEQVSEELQEERTEPSGGQQASEAVAHAASPAEAAATGRESDYSEEAFEEQASEELEDKPLKPAAGAPAPEVTVGAASPLEAKAELEAEAVPSEPSIRSAEASPVSRSSEYGDEAFEEQASEQLEDKPLKPAAGAPAPEVTVGAASPLEAKVELEAEAVPSEPSIRSAEASPVSRSSEYGDEAFEEMPSEKSKDKTQSMQEGQPTPDATARAPSSVEAKPELEAEAVPSEPSIRSAEASPPLPLVRSSEHADEASPVDQSSDYGGYGSEDFEQDPADKHGSGGPAAVPGATAKDVSSDRSVSPTGKYSDYADEPFEEQLSAELQEGTPERSGGQQVPEVDVHTPSPAEAAPTGRELGYLDEPFEEQASEELEDKPLKPAAGAPALEVAVGASPPLEAELEAEAVPSEPSIRSAEASPVSPGSDYGDEEFEEMPSEKLEDKTQKPLEGQPTPDATARAPSSAEASPRLPLEQSSGRGNEASPVDESSDYGGYGSEDFEQEPEDKPDSGGPAAVPGVVAMDAAESSDRPASPAGSDYEDEPFEEQVSAELQDGTPEPPGGLQVPEVVVHAPSPTEEQLSEELEESPTESPGGPLAPEIMGRANSPTEEADRQYEDAFEKEEISEELEDVAEPRALPLGAPARDNGEEGFQEPLEGSPISNLSSDPSGPFETEIDSGMEDLDTSGDFPDSEEPMKVIEEGDAIFNDLGMRQAGMLPTVDENSSEDEDEDNFDAEPSSVFSRPTPSMFETAGKPGERPTSSSSHSTVTSTSELFGARLRPSSAGASRSESRPGSARPGGNRPTSAGTEMSQPSPVLSDGEDVEDEPISVGTESASRSDVGDSELEEIEEALAAPSPPAPAPSSFRPPPPPEAPQQVLGPNFGHRYSEEFESDEDELT